MLAALLGPAPRQRHKPEKHARSAPAPGGGACPARRPISVAAPLRTDRRAPTPHLDAWCMAATRVRMRNPCAAAAGIEARRAGHSALSY